MKFGVWLGPVGGSGANGIDACLDAARQADALGFDSVWLEDRVVVPQRVECAYPYQGSGVGPGRAESDCYDPLVMGNAVATITSRVSIGIAALVMPLRHPVVTAKMLAVADLLSGGRVILGAGTGWLGEEFEALGLPGEWFANRGEVTSEYLRAIKEIWTNTGPSDFTGRWVEFHDVGAFPKPLQRPHPPIYIAGSSKAAMTRASRLGNGLLVIGSGPDRLRRQVERLREICLRDRRDPGEVEVALLAPVRLGREPDTRADRPRFAGSLSQVAEDIRLYAKAGLSHLIAAPLIDEEAGDGPGLVSGLRLMADEILPGMGRGPAAPRSAR